MVNAIKETNKKLSELQGVEVIENEEICVIAFTSKEFNPHCIGD